MIATETFMEAFAKCAPHLLAALEYNGGEVSLADVYDGLQSGQYLLIPGDACAIVLEPITHQSGKRVMNFFLAGGDLKELQRLEKQICEMSRADGFDSVAIFGRRGWLKRLDGYAEKAVYMEKTL